MNSVVTAVVAIVATAVVLLTLDYWDHKKYSEGDDLTSYILFITHIISRGFVPAAIAAPMLIFIDWVEYQIFMLVVSIGVLFVFYMNMYNFVSFPQRAIMILSSDIEGCSQKYPLRFMILHPTLLLSRFTSLCYLYSLNSERSVVLSFSETEAYDFVTRFKQSDTGTCSCCGLESQPVQRIKGKQMGYVDYNLVSFEHNNTQFGIASTIVVKLCEDCWSDYKVHVANSDMVDETQLMTEMI